jgi:hypothetical protein
MIPHENRLRYRAVLGDDVVSVEDYENRAQSCKVGSVVLENRGIPRPKP